MHTRTLRLLSCLPCSFRATVPAAATAIRPTEARKPAARSGRCDAFRRNRRLEPRQIGRVVDLPPEVIIVIPSSLSCPCACSITTRFSQIMVNNSFRGRSPRRVKNLCPVSLANLGVLAAGSTHQKWLPKLPTQSGALADGKENQKQAVNKIRLNDASPSTVPASDGGTCRVGSPLTGEPLRFPHSRYVRATSAPPLPVGERTLSTLSTDPTASPDRFGVV